MRRSRKPLCVLLAYRELSGIRWVRSRCLSQSTNRSRGLKKAPERSYRVLLPIDRLLQARRPLSVLSPCLPQLATSRAVVVVVRRALSLALSVSMLLALATTAEASSHRHVWRCRAHHPRVVANKRAEVWEVPEGGPPRFEGCAYGSTHRYALGPVPYGSSSGSNGSREYTLAGTTLAFTEGGCPGALAEIGSTCWEYLKVMSLRSGRRLHEVLVKDAQCNGSVIELVLKEDGAVAWTATSVEHCPVPAERRELHALDSAGERVLASGAESLKLASSMLYWRQGGRLFSASLH
jgi:hypothetical protein